MLDDGVYALLAGYPTEAMGEPYTVAVASVMGSASVKGFGPQTATWATLDEAHHALQDVLELDEVYWPPITPAIIRVPAVGPPIIVDRCLLEEAVEHFSALAERIGYGFEREGEDA